jgi:putative transposase
LDEPVGRLPTLTTNPGTPSSPRSKRSRWKSNNGNEEMRTVRLRLLPNGAQERKLMRIADTAAKLWNELNYVRLIQFRTMGKIDFKGTGREHYHRYKSVLGVNAGQVINLNNGAWM